MKANNLLSPFFCPDGPNTPIINQFPKEAELDNSVTLTCSADSLSKATIFWRFKHIQIFGPVHYIYDMEEMHLEKYTCIAQNKIMGLEASEGLIQRGDWALFLSFMSFLHDVIVWL